WEGVGNNFGWRAHRHLRLEGNGVDNAANVGLNIDGSNNGHWQNISIKGTGAQAIYCTGSNWQRFTDIVVGRPVNTSYPYIQVHRVANNYLWENVGLRSEDATTDPVACVKYTNETGYVATGHQWTGTWLENLHIAEGSAVFDVTARSCLFGFPWVFDCEAVATTSTDTTIFLIRDLLGDEGGTNPWAGGNHIVGQITGQIQDTGKSAEFHENRIAFGVKINESGTRVSGLRGFQGNNVYLAAGVEDCWIELGGAEYDQDDAVAGVVDSSGNSTNTIIDPLGVGIQWGSAAKQGFYGTTPVAQQTGVAVSAAGVHAALVNLGLITA
ncbi:MAG: hypothetical protein GY925_16075, partial [Actinomycetia bacterium]|nr:hypothetical protein [Actinomycetes bacterium]